MEQLQIEKESLPDIAKDGEEATAVKGMKKNMGKILRATITELETALTVVDLRYIQNVSGISAA